MANKNQENQFWEGLYNAKVNRLRAGYARAIPSKKGEILSSLEEIIGLVSGRRMQESSARERSDGEKELEEKARYILANPDISQINIIYGRYPTKETAEEIGTSLEMMRQLPYWLRRGKHKRKSFSRGGAFMRFAYWLLKHGYKIEEKK